MFFAPASPKIGPAKTALCEEMPYDQELEELDLRHSLPCQFRCREILYERFFAFSQGLAELG